VKKTGGRFMLDTLRKRRSVRKYKDEDIEPEIVELLKEAALRSPTSRKLQALEVRLRRGSSNA
jgi:nitroreductase